MGAPASPIEDAQRGSPSSRTRSPGAIPQNAPLRDPPPPVTSGLPLGNFLLAAPLGPRTRRRARISLQAPPGRQADGEVPFGPITAAIFRRPSPPRRGDDPEGGDCAGAHRSPPQGRGYPPLAPRTFRIFDASPPWPPRPEFRPLGGPSREGPQLTTDPRASTYAEESRVHLAASLGDRSLSQDAPRRRDGGRDRLGERSAGTQSAPLHAPLQCTRGRACSVRGAPA